MLFSTLIFLYLFLPLVLLVYFLVKEKMQNPLLLFASLIFYAWGGPSLLSILGGSVGINYFTGLLIGRCEQKRSRKAWLITGLILNLGLLAYFKYFNFFLENINAVTQIFGAAPIHLQRILLPLGISFFTFKAITYLVSVYRRETGVQKNLIDLALYISLFPQLIAGPISRYKDIAPQLNPKARGVTLELFVSGVNRLVLGLTKKILIATPLAHVADQIFGTPSNQVFMPLAWLGTICFTLQLYYDFSGYSDIAIGLGRMLGFRFVENFNFPYLSRSLREFWKRWHISLSTWFRDYLFLPIAWSTSRKLPEERYFRIKAEILIYIAGTSVTFFLCGLWHGSTWNFVIWGMLHGVVLIAEQAGMGRLLKKLHPVFQHLYLILFLLISMVFFRAGNLGDALDFIGIMFGMGSASVNWLHLGHFFNLELILFGSIAILGCTPIFTHLVSLRNVPAEKTDGIFRRIAFFTVNTGNILLMLLLLFLVTVQMTAGTINPFIYFRF
jgi:alginate O-acetyltransferase complex protein AlgI